MSPTRDSTLANPEQLIADLERQLAECRAERDEAQQQLTERTVERDEAHAQQTATAEVLQVINSSPGDLTPVFEAILEKAHTLCDAVQGAMFLFDGEHLRAVATRGMPEAFNSRMRTGYRAADFPLTQALLAGEPFNHVVDVALLDHPVARAAVELAGAHTVLAVALRKGNVLLGQIVAARREVRPFTNEQIALLQNFAAHAVIAMENARLLGELRGRTSDLQESLEYQTATSDVLKVISQSTFDLQPVLDTLVATAARLTNADQALIASREGENYRAISILAVSPEQEAFLRGYTFAPGPGSVVGRVALSRQVVQLPDLAADPEYAMLENVRLGGTRTVLGVPLLREGEPIGVLNVARQRVEPFTEKQIELVRTFADQAVIAIENARLLNDLRGRTRDLQESLEYQTATSDVLKVISQSGAELEPVLENLVETASRICVAEKGFIFRLERGLYQMVASFGFSPDVKDFVLQHPIAPGRNTLTG